MYRSLLPVGLLAMALHSSAQSYVHQVLVLNEGYFNFATNEQVIPVTLGRYDPAEGTYSTVATMVGPRFASDVIVSDGSIYVAADDRIYRLDADTHIELAVAEVAGVRKLAVWNDLLLLTRGDLGGLDHYFEVRDRSDLSFVDAITPADGLQYSAEGLLVMDDKAYLAVSNAFDLADLQGRVGIVDLPTMSYASEVDLGPEGRNPERLMAHEGDIFAFNNTDFTGSSVSRVDVAGSELEYTAMVSVNSGCAASVRVASENKIYFMEYAQNELARFDLSTGAVSDTLTGSPAVYGIVEDPINGVLYATTTDFFSSADFHVMGMDGTILSSVPAVVSPGNMALDIRSSTGFDGPTGSAPGLFPNPAFDRISLTGEFPSGTVVVTILDAIGRVVFSEERNLGAQHTTLDVATLGTGVYTVHINGLAGLRFSKQ